MAVETYRDASGSEHESRVDTLTAQGHRPISLSVYGDPGSPRYAAVWVQRAGAPWLMVNGVNAAGYQYFFDTATANGYAPVLVSATGARGAAIFAAVFEKGIAGVSLARHDMTSGPAGNAATFENQNELARTQGLILRSAAIYGTAADRRYAAVWHANPGLTKWHVHASDTAASYQTVSEAEDQLPGFALAGYRPAFVTLADDQLYCSSFRDDVVGEWTAHHCLTASAYDAELRVQTAQGCYPICLHGGGTGAATRYAAIFAKQDAALPRAWSATGTEVPALAGFDHVMQGFMMTAGVRAAQLAIAKDGVMKLSRGYTWAESGYRATQPSDRFLLASCSKMFLAAAVQSLYDSGRLTPATAVYPLLGFSGPRDARSDRITVQQILDHAGGYDDTGTGSGFDPTYSMRQIAQELGASAPVTKLDVARYMYERYTLDFDPGTNNKYSNFGYLLASAVVEHVTGQDFFAYLTATILAPEAITEILLSSTLASGRPAEQAIAENENLGLSPLDLKSSALVPWVYGGDGQIKEVAAGCAGLACSAQAMARFIHRHAVWGIGGRAPGSGRSGSTPGASTFAVSRVDGVDWALTVNTRDWADGGRSYNVLTAGDSQPGSINNQLAHKTSL
jgi:CubicO group peptidase (beta-lactamase class C family)